MSIVDKINQLFVGRLRHDQATPAIVGDALVVGPDTFDLARAAGVVAYEADVHAGAIITLTLSFEDGRSVSLTQQDACWNDLIAELDRLRLTAVPSREWLTAMIAGEAPQPMVLRGARDLAR